MIDLIYVVGVKRFGVKFSLTLGKLQNFDLDPPTALIILVGGMGITKKRCHKQAYLSIYDYSYSNLACKFAHWTHKKVRTYTDSANLLSGLGFDFCFFKINQYLYAPA